VKPTEVRSPLRHTKRPAVILLRFDYTTVRAISILFGIVAISAGILEVGVMMLAQGWWKLLNAVLAVAFVAHAARV